MILLFYITNINVDPPKCFTVANHFFNKKKYEFVLTISNLAGLDSTFGGLEAMITALCDEYPQTLARNRELFVAILLAAIYICALPTTTYVCILLYLIFGPKNKIFDLCNFHYGTLSPEYRLNLNFIQFHMAFTKYPSERAFGKIPSRTAGKM